MDVFEELYFFVGKECRIGDFTMMEYALWVRLLYLCSCRTRGGLCYFGRWTWRRDQFVQEPGEERFHPFDRRCPELNLPRRTGFGLLGW